MTSDKLMLRIQRHTHQKHNGACMIWLTAKSGPAVRCLMYGVISADDADMLSSSLGVPVEDRSIPNEVADDFIEREQQRTAGAQQKLFKELT